jgi:hypothetical protein
MKTMFTTAAFALTLGLSSLAHAGFNDQGPTLDTRVVESGRAFSRCVRCQTGRG